VIVNAMKACYIISFLAVALVVIYMISTARSKNVSREKLKEQIIQTIKAASRRRSEYNLMTLEDDVRSDIADDIIDNIIQPLYGAVGEDG
jgi:hypothetical protein